jgi:hypothetical protein
VSARGNLRIFGADYAMVGTITTGPNPRLRMTNTAGVRLFGQTLGAGLIELTVSRNDASVRVAGNVTLSGVRFRLDETYRASQLAGLVNSVSLPLPPVAFRQDLRVTIAGRAYGILVSGSAAGTLSTSPSVLASGSSSINTPAVRIPESGCVEPVCTGGGCSRPCERVCTPRDPITQQRLCERVCGPEVCTERTCTPRTCTVPESTIPAINDSSSFSNVTVSPSGFSVQVPVAGRTAVDPDYDSPAPAPEPSLEPATTSPARTTAAPRPVPIGPAPAPGPQQPRPTPTPPRPTPQQPTPTPQQPTPTPQQPTPTPQRPSPTPVTAPAPGPRFRMTNAWRGADVCLEAQEPSPGQRAVRLVACTGADAQQWVSVPAGGAAVQLTTVRFGAGMCLDVDDSSGANGQLTLSPCGSRPGQRFLTSAVSGGYSQLTTELRGPSSCVDVANDGVNNRLRLSPCGNFSGQAWLMTGAAAPTPAPGPTPTPQPVPQQPQPVPQQPRPTPVPQRPAPVPQPTPTPVTAPAPGPRFRMTNAWRGDNVCLEAQEPSPGQLALRLVTCTGDDAQQWVTVPAGGAAIQLTTVRFGAGICLDVDEGTGGASLMTLTPCSSRPGQRFHTSSVGAYTRLTNDLRGPSSCLDVVNDGTNDRVRMAPCGSYSGQSWLLPGGAEPVPPRPPRPAPQQPQQPPPTPTPVPTPTPAPVPVTQPTTEWRVMRITNAWRGPDVCLEYSPGGPINVVLTACNGSPGQVWVGLLDASGAVRLTARNGGTERCLDVVDGSNRLTFAPCGDRPGQRWHAVDAGGGNFRLSNDLGGTGRCLDVINDGTNNQLQLAPCGNYSGQIWALPPTR